MKIRKIMAGGLLVALAAALIVLGACAPGDAGKKAEAPKAEVKKVELSFWSWRPEDTDVYNALIKMFQQKNPDIAVTFSPYKSTEYNTVLSAALKGGSGPDIVQLRAFGGLVAFAQPGYIVALNDKVPELKGFGADAIRGSTWDGKVYGVPFASQTLGIYYNTKIYDKLKLKVPETWAEFLANLKAIKAAKITPIANGAKEGWTLEVMHGVICPNFYGANDFFNAVVAGKATFQDDRYRLALEKMVELKPYLPDKFMGVSYTDMQNLFINEQAAHFIGGSFEAGFFAKSAADNKIDLKFDMFAGPVAKKGDPAYVSVYLDGSFGLASSSKNQAAGLKFLSFLATKEAGQYFADNLKQLSDVPGVGFNDPFFKRVKELQKNSTPYIHLVGFRYNQPTGSTLIQAGLQGLLGGTLDSKTVVKQLQEGLAGWYEPFKKK